MFYWSVEVVVVLATACSVALLIRGLFFRVDSIAKDARSTVRDSVDSVPIKKGMLLQANELANVLFGERLFSARSFIVSIALSVTISFTLAVLFRKTWTGRGYENLSSFLIAMPVLVVVMNILPDYILLIKSRIILQAASRDTNKRQKLELAACDVISSLIMKWSAIFAIGFFSAVVIEGKSPHEGFGLLKEMASDTLRGGRPTVALLVLSVSTISMHLWILLFGVSIYLVQIGVQGFGGGRWPSNSHVNEYSFRVAGDVAAVVTAVVLIVIGSLTSLFPVI